MAQIVSAHCVSNTVAAEALPALIHRVHAGLTQVDQPAQATSEKPVPERPVPAVHPRRSVFPDHIVCLEDGKRLKMLRRHLRTAYGLTPRQYRERWDLPPDYPMTAPGYAARRSELARKIGLGHRRDADADAEPESMGRHQGAAGAVPD